VVEECEAAHACVSVCAGSQTWQSATGRERSRNTHLNVRLRPRSAGKAAGEHAGGLQLAWRRRECDKLGDSLEHAANARGPTTGKHKLRGSLARDAVIPANRKRGWSRAHRGSVRAADAAAQSDEAGAHAGRGRTRRWSCCSPGMGLLDDHPRVKCCYVTAACGRGRCRGRAKDRGGSGGARSPRNHRPPGRCGTQRRLTDRCFRACGDMQSIAVDCSVIMLPNSNDRRAGDGGPMMLCWRVAGRRWIRAKGARPLCWRAAVVYRLSGMLRSHSLRLRACCRVFLLRARP
jgi:hypothetical protein